MEENWLETVPGKSWFTIMRMYSPLQPGIDQAWRPGEIELISEEPGPRGLALVSPHGGVLRPLTG